jgi:hypothetical protein
MANNFTVCQKSIGGRFIASSDHLCVTIAQNSVQLSQEAAQGIQALVYIKRTS